MPQKNPPITNSFLSPGNYARLAAWVAIVGALLGAVGDILLLYNPAGGYLDGDYAFLAQIGRERQIWGHYLGILGIPLEVGGIYLIYLALGKSGRKFAGTVGIFGLYLMFCGVAYHGTMYPLADAVRTGPEAVEAIRAFSEPLGLSFAVIFMLLMLGLMVMILRGKTYLSRWTAWVSPVVTYALWSLLVWVVPSVGNFFSPMGFNLSMAIFFGAMLIDRRRQGLGVAEASPV